MLRLAVLLLLLVPAAAAAAPKGTLVASADGYDLYARHGARGGVCLSVLGPSGESEGECRRVFSPFEPLMTTPYAGGAPLAAALPGAVARVTVGDRSVDTVAVDGFSERFALVPRPGRAPLLRFFDAAGALVGAARPPDTGLARGGTVVFRARSTRLRVRRTLDLVPTPLQFDRTVPSTCLIVAIRNGGTQTCTQDRETSGFRVDVTSACAPARPLVSGLVSRRIRQVRIVLGDGRRLTVPTRALPAGFGPARLVAATLPRGVAFRSARGVTAGGRLTRVNRLRIGPSGLACPPEDGFLTGFAYDDITIVKRRPIAPPAVVAEAGGRALKAADGPGVTLCSGLRGLGCLPPPVDATAATLDRHGDVVSAVLSADVATVAFTFGDGTTLAAPTTAGPAYTGRYAGRVRFLAVRLPPRATVTRAVPRDATGRRVGTAVVLSASRSKTTRRVFAPGVRVARTTFDGGMLTCLRPPGATGLLGLLGVCERAGRFGSQTVVSVSCRPRRAVAFGTVPRGEDVRLRLTGGGVLRPAIRRVRGLGRVWAAVVPRGRGLVGYRYADGPERPLRVPPAAEQCGYETGDTAP